MKYEKISSQKKLTVVTNLNFSILRSVKSRSAEHKRVEPFRSSVEYFFVSLLRPSQIQINLQLNQTSKREQWTMALFRISSTKCLTEAHQVSELETASRCFLIYARKPLDHAFVGQRTRLPFVIN